MHIKGRPLNQAAILANCVFWENGTERICVLEVVVSRMLKYPCTSKGDYWNEEQFFPIASLCQRETTLKGKKGRYKKIKITTLDDVS